jgi:hypothetical protein
VDEDAVDEDAVDEDPGDLHEQLKCEVSGWDLSIKTSRLDNGASNFRSWIDTPNLVHAKDELFQP